MSYIIACIKLVTFVVTLYLMSAVSFWLALLHLAYNLLTVGSETNTEGTKHPFASTFSFNRLAVMLWLTTGVNLYQAIVAWAS